jgi:hypothetical protein
MLVYFSKLLNNAAVLAAPNEKFTNTAGVVVVEPAATPVHPMVGLIIAILAIIIVLLAGKWLWNNIATRYITILKPVPSVWHLLGLMLIIDLVLPNCAC